VVTRTVLPEKRIFAIHNQVTHDIRAVAGTTVHTVLEVQNGIIEKLIHKTEDHEITAVPEEIRFVWSNIAGKNIIE
jgi:hypothetical protein